MHIVTPPPNLTHPRQTHCPGQSDIEYKTEFTMWNMIRSVLLFATDPRNLTSIMKEVGGCTSTRVHATQMPAALFLANTRSVLSWAHHWAQTYP